MTDQPICGFDELATGPCREARDEAPGALRCAKHGQVRYMVCVGCAGLAHRECGMRGKFNVCESPLCMSCQHLPDHSHGAPEMAPSAPQEPSPGVAATQVRDQLLAALTRSLNGCRERHLISMTTESAPLVADILLDELSAHALLGLLTGMAAKGAQG